MGKSWTQDMFNRGENDMLKQGGVIVLGLLWGAIAAADDIEKNFRNPPDATRPYCYWYWLNGDITKDGITKDLEAMAKAGIQQAMIGNIEGGGPVKMFSPEWYALTRHALKEAGRVGVGIMMFNAPGWSQSGGPWIKPEQSMRRITWNEVPAQGGTFSGKVRPDVQPLVQDVAVLAVPRKKTVSIKGSLPPDQGEALSLAASSWIWHPDEEGASGAAAGVKYFRRVIQVEIATLGAARMLVSADNSYTLWINGQEAHRGSEWNAPDEIAIKTYLKQGDNVIALAVNNSEPSPAGLIAAVKLHFTDGKTQTMGTDGSWLAGVNEVDGWRDAQKNPEGWKTARVMGPVGMAPWGLSALGKNGSLCFQYTEPFKARALSVRGDIDATLYAVKDGKRVVVANVQSAGSNGDTDFQPDGPRVFSFKEFTAQEFELKPCNLPLDAVELTSAPRVAQVIEKQMGRMHPTPSPTWESYQFKDSVEPDDASTVVHQKEILNLTDKLATNGLLTCELPAGDWTILYFGMVTTGKQNGPAPEEATGLEVDKMSKSLIEYHFNSMFGKLLKELTPEEKKAWKGVTIDSYEKGAQNWTDGFEKEFKKRAGYDPIKLLPVMTGRVIDSAKASDQFLWDLRRTVADMIAEYYVAGLGEVAHKHGLTTWCENYGHWGFPGDFTIYGRYSDEIGGEFWSNNSLGTIECRAASSTAHIYGKRRVYAEAFTSGLDLGHHPYLIKRRGEELFCEGINQFVLHVVAHQPRDGVPGKNPGFGTAFHRNTPWFNTCRDWVRYLQRIHFMLQQGNPVADVAVYIGDFAPQMTGPANPVPAGYDYDFMGSDAILNNLDVKNGKWVVYDEKDRKRIAASYALLALPESGYTRPQVLKRLEALKKAGGKVVPASPVPVKSLQEAGVAPIVSETTCGLRWKARQLEDGMLFFLANFEATGTFEAKLRVTGKVPELFNPVTGEIRKIARYKAEKDGTRICINVNDLSDSFFVIFREKQQAASVVKVQAEGKDVGPAELALYYDVKNRLTAEAGRKGVYTLTLSDGTEKRVRIDKDPESLLLSGAWMTSNKDEQGFSVNKEITFIVPADFGKGQKILLDLGSVEVMAKVTLNSNEFATLWMPPFVLDVTDAVKRGENKLSVLVTSTSQGKPKLGEVKLRTVSGGKCQ
jgi:hypothetical protein